MNVGLGICIYVFPREYSDINHIHSHQIAVAKAAHATQMYCMSTMFNRVLIISAIDVILNLSFTFHIPPRILKLIWNRKLKTKNKQEYFSISADFKKLSQKSI